MDNEEAECFDISFIKARAKNIVESNILCKQLKCIDRQCRRSLSRIESELKEERRFARKLKRDNREYRKKDKLREDKTVEKLNAMDKRRQTALGKTRKTGWDCVDNVTKTIQDNNDDVISVTGQGMPRAPPCEPKMYFWSQDSSTKLPVMSCFFGYRHTLQRSMTEVKLLGQQMYPEATRETQSADPTVLRTMTLSDFRRAKTSGPRESFFDEDFCYEALKRAPPPTRENTNISEIRAGSEMRRADSNLLNVPDIKTRENTITSEISKSEIKLPDSKTKELGKSSSPQELFIRERSYMNESRARTLPLVPDTHIEKSPVENINLDLKHAGSDEQLPQLSQRTAGTAMSCVRPRKKKAPTINIKTRQEATKQYQAVVIKKSLEKPKVLTELHQSYSNIPSLMNEINKLQTTIEFLPTPKNGQYSKSAFGVSMQSAISKKVLNKATLPVAFRKNNNTMLKHYGKPFMEVKATKIMQDSTRAVTADT